MTRCSSSVAAGEVCHIIPWVDRVDTIISARIDGGLVLAGKKAKKEGCCQWVIPGITMRSTSFMMRSKDSLSSGGELGSWRRMSPGETCDLTGYSSTLSM
jgi:hypothetical protein